MSKNFSIRTDLYEKLKQLKKMAMRTDEQKEASFSDVIDFLFLQSENYAKEYQTLINSLQETTINQEGRFENSRTLAGKTILYKVKEEQQNAKQS